MTTEEALRNLKNLCDGALKMGLISKIEDAAMLHEMFLMIQNRLSEPDTINYKQFQPTYNHKEIVERLNGEEIHQSSHY